MSAFHDWLQQGLAHLGYWQIFLLMAMESSILPVPSELVMIPAGYLAKQGQLDPLLAVLAGGSGSVAGASCNYLLGRTLGRAFLLRYGKWILITERRYHEAEALFLRNARIATFVGRLLPAVRHFISLPAGVFGMAPLSFALITFLGTSMWCSVLVWVGWFLGESAIAVVAQYSHELALVVVAAIALYGGWFLGRRR
jgi:membrane protein DedA with SNARE-associated domain